jgi:cation transport regulator ChaB
VPRGGYNHGMPTSEEDLPGTLKRSPAKARRTYAKTLDSAEEQYDSEARAHQTAWAAVKHSFEKVGDHWEEKDEKGPSDEQSKQRGAAARNDPKRTHGGVDVVGNTRQELYERAKRAGVRGRSRMSKGELADALARKQG